MPTIQEATVRSISSTVSRASPPGSAPRSATSTPVYPGSFSNSSCLITPNARSEGALPRIVNYTRSARSVPPGPGDAPVPPPEWPGLRVRRLPTELGRGPGPPAVRGRAAVLPARRLDRCRRGGPVRGDRGRPLPVHHGGPAGAGRSGGPVPRAPGRRPGCKEDYAVIVRMITPLRFTGIIVSLIFSAAMTIFTCRKTATCGRISMHPAAIPGKIIMTVTRTGRRHGRAAGQIRPQGGRAGRHALPEPAPGAGTRSGVPGQRVLRRPRRAPGQVRDGAAGQGGRRPGHRGRRGVRVLPPRPLRGGRRAGTLPAGRAGHGPAPAAPAAQA